MNRRQFLKAIGWAAILPVLPHRKSAMPAFRRRRPSDPKWPSPSAWKDLDRRIGGSLVHVNFPLSAFKTNPARAEQLSQDLRNPYYLGDQVGLTQTLGWLDAWATQPSVYAVVARNVDDITEAVNFARENELRLVIKGGGHSYHGTSNAADSLLIWTRRMNDITMHTAFVPQGCEGFLRPEPAVTLGSGTIWMAAYDAITTRSAKYVQGGGCTTVGVAGLIQSGGFGSFSKHYGLAAGSLLEAEIVTADGKIRVANPRINPDLFWALKGGGGGNYGVVSNVTLRLHDLPEFFGVANFTVKATSDDAYRRLIREFVSFYREHLFNEHWGEQVHVNPDNTLDIRMVFYGLDTEQANKIWRPFLDFLARWPQAYSLEGRLIIAAIPARHMWDLRWWKDHWPELGVPNPNGSRLIASFVYILAHFYQQPVFKIDRRPGAGPDNVWWAGDAGQVGWFIWGYESLWLPATLLDVGDQQRLAQALFASSRYSRLELHLNKGLAGAPPDVIAAAKDTATNPAVLTAFALAITADGQGPAYPGIATLQPSVAAGRKAVDRIGRCMSPLSALAPNSGSYVSESNYFEKRWQQSYWGSNYPRLAEIKKKYDPEGLFYVHNGVGSEEWTADGFIRR
ncbi:MAG: FAD-binding oxidoreductase [Deltaproteobacteria bacterium]|nr:FAD-binding oxidoreductase [Deltaproteobacteria bacterium]